MTELQEGPIMLKDLSVWFGLRPETLAKSRPQAKEKKMKILSAFADWHYEGKKIIIDRVKIPVYSKAYEIVEKEAPKEWGKVKDKNYKITPAGQKKIDTSARVGKTIYAKVPEINSQISVDTTQQYVGLWKRKNYGRNYIKNDKGALGSSHYVWMNKEGTDVLSEAEYRIVLDCAHESYQECNDQMAMIDDAYYKGEISMAEYKEAKGELNTKNSYLMFVALVVERLGFFPEKRTQLVDELVFED